MKLIEATPEKLVFQISREEQNLLLKLIGLYPVIPSGHQRVCRPGDAEDMAEEQKLLDEALAVQRAQTKARLQKWLAAPERFVPHGPAFRLELSVEEVEWLLQVLADIRVGSWIRLGAPDYEAEKQLQVTRENVQFLWAREVSGLFQMVLLAGLNERP